MADSVPISMTGEETPSRKLDRKLLSTMSSDELIDLLFAQMRMLWTVDGFYYMGIEEQFGTEAATAIDARTWRSLGKLECRKLREVTGLKGDDMGTFQRLLRLTSWALDLEDKEFERKGDVLILRNVKCRVQSTRTSKGLPEFGCRAVREGYLQAFTTEFSPRYRMNCKVCPPGRHPEGVWCEWEFVRGD